MSFLPRCSVLVPVDFDESGFEAVKIALELAGDRGAVHVLHVVPHGSPVDAALSLGDPEDDLRLVLEAEERLVAELDTRELFGVEVRVVAGDVAAHVLGKTRSVGADLIVIPSHGRTGLAHLALGSVAEKVRRGTRVPVLVLHRD